MKVTPTRLRLLGACVAERRKFTEVFPRGVVVTEALCAEHAATFDWNWAAASLLSSGARAEYDRVRDLARVEYDRVCGLAWAEHGRVCGLARAEYSRVCGLAWAEYCRVRASAFGRLAEKEQS